MPSKKKRGKGSKLARMSEEEKLRYLQYRAEIELEAKRRKQQLIAAFTKNKLKREEAFARLNIAKINEQWRFQLRQFKCRELHDNLEYLWRYIDTALRAKNAVIDKLYEKLNIADIDHQKLQTSHIKMIDEFINNYQMNLDKLYQRYMKSMTEIKIEELNDMKRKNWALNDDCKPLEVVAYAQSIFIENRLLETKIGNAINTTAIENLKKEDEVYIENEIDSRIHGLRSVLNGIITDYRNKTKDKKKYYDNLEKQDMAHRNEVSSFPGLQTTLIHTIESFKYHKNVLTLAQKKTISKLTNQIGMLNKRIHELRRGISINQAADEIQLKKQTTASNSVIKYLDKLRQKSTALEQLITMCSSFERTFPIVNEYGIHCRDNVPKQNICCIITPYDKLEKFWHKFNYMKSKNIFLKISHDQLIAENDKLRDCLRLYLTAIAQVPNTELPNYNLI